jgi:polyribonucleotide nucleotidyltransferase
MFNTKTVSIEWGGQTLTLETGKVARQADGAVIASLWRNCCALRGYRCKVGEGRPGFLPADRHYQEKYFSQPAVSPVAFSSANAAPPKRKRWFPA